MPPIQLELPLYQPIADDHKPPELNGASSSPPITASQTPEPEGVAQSPSSVKPPQHGGHPMATNLRRASLQFDHGAVSTTRTPEENGQVSQQQKQQNNTNSNNISPIKVGRRKSTGGFHEATDRRRFSVSAAPSVATKRLATVGGVLFPAAAREAEVNDIIGFLLSEKPVPEVPVSKPDPDNRAPQGGRRHSMCAAIPTFGKGGLGDKFTEQWDWPLAQPIRVSNTDAGFEALFDVSPFTAEEVEAHVMCTDLNISLTKKTAKRVFSIDRTYHLPLNVDPKSVKFFVSEQNGKFKVTANVIPPLVMHVASFADLSDLQTLKSGISVENLIQLRRMRDSGIETQEIEDFLQQILEQLKSSTTDKSVSSRNEDNAEL